MRTSSACNGWGLTARAVRQHSADQIQYKARIHFPLGIPAILN